MEVEQNKTENNNRQKSSLFRMVHDFCGYTSFGGLGRVVGTNYAIFRVLWVLLFLVAFGMAVFQLIPLFYKYQSRPINTRISLKYNSSVDFPSVVLCNFNMVRKTNVGLLPLNVREALKEYYSDDKKSIADNSGGDDYDEEEEGDFINPDLLDKMYKAEEKLSVLMADVDKDTLKIVGHQFDDMINECTFKGVNCRNLTRYWSQFWHYKYGNCFVFNPSTMKNRLVSSKPGPLYGLTVKMNIEQHEYIDSLTQDAGAAVLISPRGQMPFPYEEGLSLAPGYATSMGLRLVQVNREDPFKNNSCIKNEKAHTNKNIYTKEYNASYSRVACEQSCTAYSQLAECNCMEYKFPGQKGYFCDILNKTVVTCLRKVARKAQNNQLPCLLECQPLCLEHVFQITSSFSKWPSTKYLKHIAQEQNENDKNITDQGGGLSNNHLKIKIFFQELNYEMIEESISYQIENFLSDIGGQLGLWLGVSILSGAEVVELLAMMLIFLLTGKTNNRSKSSTSPGDQFSNMEEGKLEKKTSSL